MKKLFHVTVDFEEEKTKALDAEHIEDCLFSPLRFEEKWRGCVTVTEVEAEQPICSVTDPDNEEPTPPIDGPMGAGSATAIAVAALRLAAPDDPVLRLSRAGR